MLAPINMKCVACGLAATRKQVVIGDGDFNSPVMLVGEAPGEYEDMMSLPFQGRCGRFLRKILQDHNLEERVYITNAVKCRPPANRRPTDEEVEACSIWLSGEVLDRKLIITLGQTATNAIIPEVAIRYKNFGQMVKNLYTVPAAHGLVTVMPAYHPSYAMRNGKGKRNLEYTFGYVEKVLDDMRYPSNGGVQMSHESGVSQ